MATGSSQPLPFQDVFRSQDKGLKGYLTAEELSRLFSSIRREQLSLQQVVASVETVCAGDTCDPDEFLDCLKEMDRRYALVQDLRWEFCMLAGNGETISESKALFLMKAVHDEFFSQRRWQQFVSTKMKHGRGVTFDEIEVELCNIPDRNFIEWEREMEEKEKAEAAQRQEEERKRKEKEEQERRREEEERARKLREERRRQEAEIKKRKEKEEMEQREREEKARREKEERERREAEEKRRKEEEKRRKEEEEEKARQQREEEERLRREEELRVAAERAAEAERQAAMEEQRKLDEKRRQEEEANQASELAEEAAKAEAAAGEQARCAAEEAAKASTEEEKRKAKEKEAAAKKKQRTERAKRLNNNLQGAIKSRQIERLEPAIKEAEEGKKEKLEEMDEKRLEEAKKLLKQLQTAKNLNNAIGRRKMEVLEEAMKAVKHGGFEQELAKEMAEASHLMVRLKRLEQLKKEVLNLDSRTFAELKSYTKPPQAVHDVMIAVFLVLGHSEKETNKWQTIQPLMGKTGKESLKRRVNECEPDKIKQETGERVEAILRQYDLQTINEASRGAAVFYVWVLGMVEESKA